MILTLAFTLCAFLLWATGAESFLRGGRLGWPLTILGGACWLCGALVFGRLR